MQNHFLGIQQLSREKLETVILNSENLLEISTRDIKKVPALRGKTIINLFLESSTRTRASFEIAAKWLSADAINISSTGSSVKKGETLLDTARNLESMAPNVIVIRHSSSGAADFLAKNLKRASVVNAGDGMNEHPSQAILDCLTIKRELKRISGITVTIIGDIRHSRVARSNIYAHKLLGNKIKLVGPSTLVPDDLGVAFGEDVTLHNDLEEGIKGSDIIMCLRMQLERQEGFFVPNFVPNLDEYSRLYCLTKKIVDKNAPNAFILHPGPINRGIEISSELADSQKSLIGYQVNSGVSARMAILLHACSGNRSNS